MKGAEAIVKSLMKEGVEHIFGYPGAAIMPVYDVLLDAPLEHILVSHEQIAAHAAEGYAKASGKTGVCMSTSGPGATNLVTGLADAFLDSVPIVALSGQVSTHLIGNDAFQEADLFGLAMAITKHNFKIMKSEDIPSIFKKAFFLAKNGRPGPIHIDLPKDIQLGELEFNYPEKLEMRRYDKVLNSKGHPIQIKKSIELLSNAERPLILAGGGVIISNASQELQKLSETISCPVATTLMGKGAIPENHPLSLGMVGMHGKRVANYALSECDVLLAIGCRFSDRITGNLSDFSKNKKIIHIDIDAAEISKNVNADIPIVADAKKVLQSMLPLTLEKKHWKMQEMKNKCKCNFNLNDEPIKPQKIIHEINQIMDENTIITTDVGQNQMFAAHFLNVNYPRQFITSGGLGTMGFGLPAAIGAKAAFPDKKVINISGDGGLLMNIHSFATSVNYGLPVVVCLLNNNWLGMVKQWQKLFLNKRYSSTYLKRLPDFVNVAKAFGGDGEKVTKPSEITEAIQRGIKSNTLYIIDIAIDPEEDILPMVPPGSSINNMTGIERCFE